VQIGKKNYDKDSLLKYIPTSLVMPYWKA